MRTPSLFPSAAKSEFVDVSRQKYNDMARRAAKNSLELPFTKAQFRSHVLTQLGEDYGGAIRCRYCGRYCTLVQTACDHAIPLSRGGSLDLCNLEFPCQICNQAKGSMRPEEFTLLLSFLEREIPLARTDVLGRLAKAVKLATSVRRNAARINELKQGGQWHKPKKIKPPMVQAIEEAF